MITFFSVRTKNLLVKEILAGNFFHFQIISTHDYFSAPQYFASIWKHTTFICFTCLDQWAIFLSEAKKSHYHTCLISWVCMRFPETATFQLVQLEKDQKRIKKNLQVLNECPDAFQVCLGWIWLEIWIKNDHKTIGAQRQEVAFLVSPVITILPKRPEWSKTQKHTALKQKKDPIWITSKKKSWW